MNCVKALRLRAGMKQSTLALAVGVAQPTVSEWELQKKDPSGERLKKLCEVFHCTEDDILSPGDDTDSWYIRERLRRNPDMRILFDAADKATPEHLRAAAAVLKALEHKDDD